MIVPIEPEWGPLRVDEDGVVRVGDSRVTLDTIVWAVEHGDRPEEIVQSYPALHLADVSAIVDYCRRHRPEVDAYLAERQRIAAVIRQKIEADPRHDVFHQRLLERRQQTTRSSP